MSARILPRPGRLNLTTKDSRRLEFERRREDQMAKVFQNLGLQWSRGGGGWSSQFPMRRSASSSSSSSSSSRRRRELARRSFVFNILFQNGMHIPPRKKRRPPPTRHKEVVVYEPPRKRQRRPKIILIPQDELIRQGMARIARDRHRRRLARQRSRNVGQYSEKQRSLRHALETRWGHRVPQGLNIKSPEIQIQMALKRILHQELRLLTRPSGRANYNASFLTPKLGDGVGTMVYRNDSLQNLWGCVPEYYAQPYNLVTERPIGARKLIKFLNADGSHWEQKPRREVRVHPHSGVVEDIRPIPGTASLCTACICHGSHEPRQLAILEFNQEAMTMRRVKKFKSPTGAHTEKNWGIFSSAPGNPNAPLRVLYGASRNKMVWFTLDRRTWKLTRDSAVGWTCPWSPKALSKIHMGAVFPLPERQGLVILMHDKNGSTNRYVRRLLLMDPEGKEVWAHSPGDPCPEFNVNMCFVMQVCVLGTKKQEALSKQRVLSLTFLGGADDRFPAYVKKRVALTVIKPSAPVFRS